jgi:hypothetical protein
VPHHPHMVLGGERDLGLPHVHARETRARSGLFTTSLPRQIRGGCSTAPGCHRRR